MVRDWYLLKLVLEGGSDVAPKQTIEKLHGEGFLWV